MSGHSKWSSIKHKKALTDAKKGQQFTKMAREITIAAREGGGSPDGNYRLRLAGGNLGATGSVAWMFTRQGQIVIDANGRDPDEIGLEAIDMGAGDARVDGKTVDVVTDPARLESLQQGLKKKGYKIDSAEV